MASLDRLSSVKDVIRSAAIGREFSHELVSLVSPLGDNDLQDALVASWRNSELVHRRGQGADTKYVFKNALVQDVAYDSIAQERPAVAYKNRSSARGALIQNDRRKRRARNSAGPPLSSEKRGTRRAGGRVLVGRGSASTAAPRRLGKEAGRPFECWIGDGRRS